MASVPLSPRHALFDARADSVMAAAENDLLSRLPRRERLRLVAISESVHLESGSVLYESTRSVRHAYFPHDCSIALVTTVGDHSGPGVALVGREGMLGVQLVLGVSATPFRALVQHSGTARRIKAMSFRYELARSKALQGVMNDYLYVSMAQFVTSVACAHLHSVSQRLALWLLMSQDRAHSDSLHLTQEFLAYIVGARRSGITGAAGDLQRCGLIRYRRGEITVLDRRGLQSAACGCYAARDAHERMLS